MRCTGFPVAYITETKEFYGRDFFVNPAVLIPKPDTEILVQRGIEIISKKLQTKENIKLVDLCTGSGCVGISVKNTDASYEVLLGEFAFVPAGFKEKPSTLVNILSLKVLEKPDETRAAI